MAVSTIAGLMRGLLREVIALVTWVTAVWLAWRFAGVVEPHLGGLLANEGVRTWAARAHRLHRGAADRLGASALIVNRLGAAVAVQRYRPRLRRGFFGLLRGLVMLGLFVILCHALRLEGEPWWRGSLLVPYAEHAANVLRSMVGERKIVAGNSATATL